MFHEFFTRRMGHKTSERSGRLDLLRQQKEKLGSAAENEPLPKGTVDALLQIDKLDALGLKPKEIIATLKLCLDDDDTSACMNHKIKSKCDELKIDDGDLENLLSAQRIERQITRMQVMKIVNEEIKK